MNEGFEAKNKIGNNVTLLAFCRRQGILLVPPNEGGELVAAGDQASEGIPTLARDPDAVGRGIPERARRPSLKGRATSRD